MRNSCRSTRSSKSNSSANPSINALLSEFDQEKATSSKETDELLYPSHVNYEYRRIRNAVIYHGKLSKEDNAATLIQKTFRMYVIKRFFTIFLKQYRHVKYTTMRPYFIAFVLNAHAHSCNRRKLYEEQFKRTLFCSRIFHHYYHPSYEVFSATDQCLLHPSIDGETLRRFVKKMYHSRMKQLFSEWHLIARKQRVEKNYMRKLRIDNLKRLRFGGQYVCFIIWHRFTQLRRNKPYESKAILPQWNHYMLILEHKAAKLRNADNQRLMSIKRAGVQALMNIVIERREEEMALRESDNFRMKKSMLFALSAWAHYIVIQRGQVNTKRTVLRKWFGGIQLNSHLRSLSKQFEPRHALYTKRRFMSILIKNRKISQITNAYIYCKMQTKPSLALFFISVLMKDDHKYSFYLAMHAWTLYMRRRKKWHQFVFQNIKSSDYDITKRKALAALKQQTTPVPQIPISLISQPFQQETLYLYEYVMKSKADDEQIFLLSDNEKAKEEVKKTKEATHLRNLFFKMWMTMKPDPSLLMRVVMINAAHQRSLKAKAEMKPNQRSLDSFKRALEFLKSYNLASEGKFKALQRTIVENNKRSLSNRKRCTLRDNMIIYAHYSHYDANSLKEIRPLFKTSDKLKIVAQIKARTDELTKAFTPLISIQSLGSVLEQNNTYTFSDVSGCRSMIPIFDVDYKKYRREFIEVMKRAEISPSNQIHFDQLMVGTSHEAAHRHTRTYQKVDLYQSPIIEAKSEPYTGVNRRLLEMFPLKGRQPIKIGHQTGKALNFNILNTTNEEEEDLIDLRSIERGNLKNSVLTMEKSKGSMFFSAMNSFMSFVSHSSSLFSSSVQSSNLNFNNLDGIIEEVDKDYDSEGENEDGSQRNHHHHHHNNVDEHGYHHHHHKEYEETEYVNEDSDYDEVDEETGETGRKHIKSHRDSSNNEKTDEKGVAGLKDTFDEVIIQGTLPSGAPKSPKAMKKFGIFMEILFGKNSRDHISIPMANLRRKLLQELNYQKNESSVPGIKTHETIMPISSLMEAYHQDKEKDEEEPETRKNVTFKQQQQQQQPIQNGRNVLFTGKNDAEGEDEFYEEEEHDDEKEYEYDYDYEYEEDEETKQRKKTAKNKRKKPKPKAKKPKPKNNHPQNTKIKPQKSPSQASKQLQKPGQKALKSQQPQKQQPIPTKKSFAQPSKGKLTPKGEQLKNPTTPKEETAAHPSTAALESPKFNAITHSRRYRPIVTPPKKKTKVIKKVMKKVEGATITPDGTIVDQEGNVINGFVSNGEIVIEEEVIPSSASSSSSEDLEDYFRERPPVSEIPDGEINEEEEEKREEEEEISESAIDIFAEEEKIGNTKLSSSDVNKHTSKSRRSQNSSMTPFVALDEGEDDQDFGDAMNVVDKLVFSYVKKSLKNEDDDMLVDVDEDEYEFEETPEKKKKNKIMKRKLWQPPKFYPLFKPKMTTKKNRLAKLAEKGKLNVISHEHEFTNSMRQAIGEDKDLNQVIFNDGKTVINHRNKSKNTMSSVPLYKRKPMGQLPSPTESELFERRLVTNYNGKVPPRNSTKYTKLNSFNEYENNAYNCDNKKGEQTVVSFSGGKRGIIEEPLDLQRIRNLRQKQLLNMHMNSCDFDTNTGRSISSTSSTISQASEMKHKAHEMEDINSTYSNMRSIVGQLIQMMASAQDDSDEFNRLRKRARMLRKKPTFVGLYENEKQDPALFYKQLQSTYVRYSRRKNTRAAADELLYLMQENAQYAPIILNSIEKTAEEEKRYLDSKLQKSRLGKQPADPSMTVHYIDLDWMNGAADYKAVALQYQFGQQFETGNLKAIIAPTDNQNRFDTRPGKRFRRAAAIKYEIRPQGKLWDRTIDDFTLDDFMMISSFVPDELVDCVIDDHKKIKARKI
ncbi:hypothetical protein TRFO_10587 [Tritrichomonas foetus]|uniref:IQ calmodulin-binding motif family protein n=1 Tax=Tritrichomonas foetus TaxID=1144522 RepID=A0A1J4J8G0_9EUKA|nr:hypothetical protein TRFO_10587 [Tritrichomonas foetus]|eukprot:OHS95424.1 hypothetical protein TRFO_10587 [Tritrichomonas foetus]